MQRLKSLREEFNYTQHHIAEMLKTTQQTIARWETGKAEPSIAALRDLAMIFNTSVDDLLGNNPFSKKVMSNSLHYGKKDSDVDGFWGHLGLLIPGQKQTKWFPITLDAATRVSATLYNAEENGTWLNVSTLNNKYIVFNSEKLRRVWLLDDACDAPGDWSEEARSDCTGEPQEFYKVLDDYDFDDSEKESISDTLRAVVDEFIKERKFDEDGLIKFLKFSTIYMADGDVTSYWANPEALYDFVFHINLGVPPKIVSLPAEGGDFESYYPLSQLAVVEMPLLEVMSAAKEDMDEITG